MKKTSNPRHALAFAVCTLALTGGVSAFGQTGSATKEETVQLPQFNVSENRSNPYQSRQALSASRIAVQLMDIPQTLSVVPKEFLEDAQGMRMLDAAKYVTPVQENTLPFGGDRYTIRGFTVSAEFIDGTNISGADGYSTSQQPYNIERIEVIKGPNAILVPGGSPGGVMNPITKSPLAHNTGSITLELAQYASNAVSFDANRVLTADGKGAARLVFAAWKTDYYVRDQVRNGYEVSPSFSYQLSPAHKLTLKADFMQNRETNLGGLPLDPTVGGTMNAQTARGLPRDWQFGNEIDRRHRATERGSFELLSTLGSHVTSRLFGMADHVRRIDVGGTSAAISGAGGGSRNPNTGYYEPGINWNTAAYNAAPGVTLVGTSVPVTDPSTWVYTRNNGANDLEYTEAHIKNDYAILFEQPLFKSTTITGYAGNISKVRWISPTPAARPSVPANNLSSITYPHYVFNKPTPGFTTDNRGIDRTGKQSDLQVFAYETLGFWQDRLQLSGGVSRFFGVLSRTDSTGTAVVASLPNSPAYNLTCNATSFGVVVKPTKEVSVFYSRNTTGGALPGSLNAGVTDPNAKLAEGGQKEYGLKTELLGGKLTGSVAYFDIAQSNYAVTNSEYYSLVAAGRLAEAAALPQALYMNLKSKGWEFEGSWAVNKSLTFLGNYTSVKIRQPITDVRLRGVPDRSWGLFADYRFNEGALRGFGVNVGIDNKSDVAGENATGYTTTRPLPNGKFVANQPSFLVAGRTVTNVTFNYRQKNWSASISILNALDEEYILAAGSRTSVVVGTPRNWKSSVTYKF
ncbi:MAG: TonB-dependent receptor plug domain-containing protein [Verrucomicrobia bacterium]|nr:TonB-dependent receptor plug domain-containing protein [Verrucomicrobiota bacterium]